MAVNECERMRQTNAKMNANECEKMGQTFLWFLSISLLVFFLECMAFRFFRLKIN